MAKPKPESKIYGKITKNYPAILAAVSSLGETIRSAGPLDEKSSQLIQLAAAAAVHSHTKRALDAGASPKEIEHAILLLISVIGFPRSAAALSWAYDVLNKK